jgi:hypothetical protein
MTTETSAAAARQISAPRPLEAAPPRVESKIAAKSEDYIRFVRAQGYRILEGESCYWIEKRSHLWESAPSHRLIRLSSREASMLFRRGAIAIRYTCQGDRGTPSFQYLWDNTNFGLGSLHRDACRNVQKNLDLCQFMPIDFEFLAREGCAINRAVFARQGRDKEEFQTDEQKWKAYMKVCAEMPFLEAYGIFVRERLCAYSVVIFCDDYCYTLHPYAHPDSYKNYTMNVLLFRLVESLLQRPGVRCVSYGVEPYTPRPTLERFKIAMGCRKAPLGRHIVVHPLARPIFSSAGSWLVEHILRPVKPRLAAQFSIFSEAVRGQLAARVVKDSSLG